MKQDVTKTISAGLDNRLNFEKNDRQTPEVRLVERIKLFYDGNFEELLNDEVIKTLQQDARVDSESNVILIEKLFLAISSSDHNIRERVVTLLCQLLQELDLACETVDLPRYLFRISTWLHKEEIYFQSLGTLIIWLSDAIVFLLKREQFEATATFFAVADRIIKGTLFKDQRIKNDIYFSLNVIGTPDTIDLLWGLYYENKNATISSILISLGTISAKSLVQKLNISTSDEEKNSLIILIARHGKLTVPILQEFLVNSSSDSHIIDILNIYGEMGDAMFFEDIKHFANDPQEKVQLALINTCLKMTGPSQADNLIEILTLVDPKLQNLVAKKLADFTKLKSLSIVANYFEANFESLLGHENLLVSYCLILEKEPSHQIVKALENLVDACEMNPRLTRVKSFALRSLAVMKPVIRHQTHNSPITKEIIKTDKSAVARAKLIVGKVNESAVEQAAGKGNRYLLNLLLKNGLALIEKREFLAALLINEKLVKLDSSKSAKYNQIKKLVKENTDPRIKLLNHIEPILRAYFTQQECHSLVELMFKEKYKTGDYLVRQGEFDSCLYFLLTGELHIYCLENNKNIFLKKLLEGESCGHKSFFNTGLVTESVVATQDSIILSLDVDDFKQLASKHPEINERMLRFCKSYHQVPSFIKMSGSDRRQNQRYRIKSSVRATWGRDKESLSPENKAVLFDISSTGAAIILPEKIINDIRLFLGSEIRITIDSICKDTELSGQVVAIREYKNNTGLFTVHISFFNSISNQQLVLATQI